MQDVQELETSLALDTQEEVKGKQEETLCTGEPEKIASRKNPKRHASLYQVLDELREEDTPSASALDIDIIDKNRRKAFLIHIDDSLHNHLFEGYSLEERHFSIDKIVKKKFGYPPLHYTEIYASKTKKIIVHVNLDVEGQYVNQQIKEMEGDKRKDFKIESEKEKLLQGRLQANVNVSMRLITFLFQERRERYLRAKARTDALEVELLERSRYLGDGEGLSGYIKKVREIIAALQVLNKYSEIPDSRMKYFEKALAGLNEWSAKLHKARAMVLKMPSGSVAEQDLPEESASPEVDLSSSKELPSRATQEIYASAIKELEKLAKELSEKIDYSVKDLQKIKERHEFFEEADTLLTVVLLEFSDFLSIEVTGKILKLMKQHGEIGCKILEEEALKGNLAAVQELFPLFGNKIGEEFYQELLKFVVCKKPEENQGLIKICEFFNLNSACYRNTVFEASKKQSYSFSKGERTNLVKRLKFSEQDLIGDGSHISLLFKVYCDGNLALFEMLLKHQADPNTWSFVKNGAPLMGCSIFNAIPVFATSDYLSYLKLLLCYHVDSDLVITKELTHSCIQGKLRIKKEMSRKGKKPMGKFEPKSATLAAPMSALGFSIHHRDVHGFKLLLSHASVKTIAYSFSEMLHFYEFGSLMYDKSSILVQFENSKDLAIKRQETDTVESIFSLGCIFFPGPEQILGFGMFKLLYEKLTFELGKMDQKKFDAFYENLYSLGASQFAAHDRNNAYYFIEACQFSLLARCSTLKSQKEQLELFKTYCPTLCDTLKKVLPTVLEGDILKLKLTVYEKWVNGINQAYKATRVYSSISSSLELSFNEGGSISSAITTTSSTKDSDKKILSERFAGVTKELTKEERVRPDAEQAWNSSSSFNSYLPLSKVTRDSEVPLLPSQQLDSSTQKIQTSKKKKKTKKSKEKTDV